MSRPHQERGEGDGPRLVGLGGLVVAGRDATPLLETVEAPFHDVALLVELLVEAGRASASAAAAAPLRFWSARSGMVWAMPRLRSQVRIARELWPLSPST